jgi:lipopolysaccharide export system permease protein
MIKKLDKLILKAFFGPFILTFLVVVFILLTQFILKYFDEFVGKNLGIPVFAELLFYFSVNLTPVALPLAVLLSSLMTFGNLGEHFELTAIKSAGISLLRALQPIFIFVVLLTIAAFFSNNYIVPKANLKAYSLLYDIRQKKPSLDLKEGAFYNGIPGYSIKVKEKMPDGEGLKKLIIYNHTKGFGNKEVTFADSGRMYTFMNDRYMMLEMYNGTSYSESDQSSGTTTKGKKKKLDIPQLTRSDFYHSKLVFSLSSFDLQRTREELFAGNRLMKNIKQLNHDLDSMNQELVKVKDDIGRARDKYFTYHFKPRPEKPGDTYRRHNKKAEKKNQEKDIEVKPSTSDETLAMVEDKSSLTVADTLFAPFAQAGTIVANVDTASNLSRLPTPHVFERFPKFKPNLTPEELVIARVDSIMNNSNSEKIRVVNFALSQARFVKNNVSVSATKNASVQREYYIYEIEKLKKYSAAAACLVMFMIGAPLGAIIKRGGLGVPVIVSILFFIISYVLTMMGEKWAKEGLVSTMSGVWAPNLILLPFGLFFLRQARKDSRVFESDFYVVLFNKLKSRFSGKKHQEQ